MTTRARLAVGSLLWLVAGLILAGAPASGTFATFTAETDNPGAVLSGGWIPAPTGLSDSVTGANNNKAQLDWTSGASAAAPSPNPVTGQELDIADGGSGSTANCGSYSAVATYLKGKTSVTDGGTGVPIADWWCYQMVSTSASSTSSGSWTNSATFPPIQLLVPVSVVFSGNGDGIIESGETITITYNQPVAAGSLAINSGICQVKGATGKIYLGYTGTCASGAAYSIGRITGIHVTGATGGTTATVSAAGDVVTITATAAGQGVTAGGTFAAAGAVTDSSGSIPACTAAACDATPTGAF